MLTVQKIRDNFSYTTTSETYHDTVVFEGHGELCDVYFVSNNKEIKQKQVDIFNLFKNNFKSYLNRIEEFIDNNLRSSEIRKVEEIKQATLLFDVIQIPYEKDKYDFVLVCGKTYKHFMFFKKEIGLRVEFKNSHIQSIQRKKDTTIDND